MFLRKLGKRGVAMTEYAVLLAFVAAIGGSFASDNGLGQSIMNAITGAKNAITDAGSGQATGKHPLKTTGLIDDVATALDFQTSIPYDFITARLGEGQQLQAISFNNNGKVAYQSVFHSHIHLIPRYSDQDDFKMIFKDNSGEYNDAKYKEIQESIKRQFDNTDN